MSIKELRLKALERCVWKSLTSLMEQLKLSAEAIDR